VLKLVWHIVLCIVLLTLITSIEMVGSCVLYASQVSLKISVFHFMVFNIKLSLSYTIWVHVTVMLLLRSSKLRFLLLLIASLLYLLVLMPHHSGLLHVAIVYVFSSFRQANSLFLVKHVTEHSIIK
jgi:hypothetical protein